jgi:formate hydrogenlyase subunit 5
MRLADQFTHTRVEELVTNVAAQVAHGDRFCGLFASPQDDGVRLLAVLSRDGQLSAQAALVPDGIDFFPSLTPMFPAASWYEREVQDLFGLVPLGHPRPGPLVLPLPVGAEPPRPGSGAQLGIVTLDLTPPPPHVRGEGVFTIPYGPVRSGVFEAVEYDVETSGEDIPWVQPRVFYKHRGVEARFSQLRPADGALLAERYEGVASVAHAIAYCGALEQIAGAQVPALAAMIRVVHAELERVANHLDSVVRHTEAAGQAVAQARLSTHKEVVQRLRAQLCGSRFGRGVVVPGGVSSPLRLGRDEVIAALDRVEHDVTADLGLLLATPSFVDRLRGTGVLPPELARQRAALGPVGRASGQVEDVRISRPYAAYGLLGHRPVSPRAEGDALARQRVRAEEIAGSFHLLRQAVDEIAALMTVPSPALSAALGPLEGEAIGWAEAPQGEVLYLVKTGGGRLARVKVRSASFHNLAFFHSAFRGDILTDFAFIEASFGLSIAGVAG